jgi:hypothetical protein
MRPIIMIAAISIAIAAAGTLYALLPASAAGQPVIYNYAEGWHHGKVKPARIIVGANVPYLSGLAWSHWTSTAYGRGTLHLPSIACLDHHPSYQCPNIEHRSSVRLWDIKTHHGQPYFSEMRLRYYTAAGKQVTQTWRVTSKGYLDQLG